MVNDDEENSENKNLAANFITRAKTTISKILKLFPPEETGAPPISFFRQKAGIDTLIKHRNLVKIFYISTHGEVIDHKFICPEKTLILQTGAGEHCHRIINAGLETVLLQGPALTQTLYEMAGLCAKPSHPHLTTLYYNTYGDGVTYPVPNKILHISKRPSLDRTDRFGIFYVDDSSIERITDPILYKDLYSKDGTTTNKLINLMNSKFPGSINIYYFSSCSVLPKEEKYKDIAYLWSIDTHYPVNADERRKFECGVLDSDSAAYLKNLYVNAPNIPPGPSPANIVRWSHSVVGPGPHSQMPSPADLNRAYSMQAAASYPPSVKSPDDDNVMSLVAGYKRGGYHRKRTQRLRHRHRRTHRNAHRNAHRRR